MPKNSNIVEKDDMSTVSNKTALRNAIKEKKANRTRGNKQNRCHDNNVLSQYINAMMTKPYDRNMPMTQDKLEEMMKIMKNI